MATEQLQIRLFSRLDQNIQRLLVICRYLWINLRLLLTVPLHLRSIAEEGRQVCRARWTSYRVRELSSLINDLSKTVTYWV
jgi:hypothetical protein